MSLNHENNHQIKFMSSRNKKLVKNYKKLQICKFFGKKFLKSVYRKSQLLLSLYLIHSIFCCFQLNGGKKKKKKKKKKTLYIAI